MISAVEPAIRTSRSVTAGRVSRSSSSVIRAFTSSVAPIWMKLPRPTSAMRLISRLFGAEPMPIMNTRLRPRDRPIASSISASLLIDPSVMKISWRTRPSAGVGSTRAARSAGSISVPPCASSESA